MNASWTILLAVYMSTRLVPQLGIAPPEVPPASGQTSAVQTQTTVTPTTSVNPPCAQLPPCPQSCPCNVQQPCCNVAPWSWQHDNQNDDQWPADHGG